MRFPVWFGGALVAASLIASPLTALPPAHGVITTVIYHGQKYSVSQFDPSKDDLRLFWADKSGNALVNFSALQKQVASEGGTLVFAANAGMFTPAGKPCGLLVQDEDQKFPLNLNDGPGNFYLKPNGIFVINARRHALVIESSTYPALPVPAVWATQSGPLLVHVGDINPDFMPDSKNRYNRSGVGITAEGKVIFVLSELPVTFYEFAELFRAKLNCPNALYLDGGISDFWQSGDIEPQGQHHFGPMIGVVEDTKHEGVTATPATP
jgi:uncharacterized protein YigE (DUF2233 family)